MKTLIIKAQHWYDYFNPFWWRRKRIAEAVLNSEWKRLGMQAKIESALADAVMYGEGGVEIDWYE